MHVSPMQGVGLKIAMGTSSTHSVLLYPPLFEYGVHSLTKWLQVQQVQVQCPGFGPTGVLMSFLIHEGSSQNIYKHHFFRVRV